MAQFRRVLVFLSELRRVFGHEFGQCIDRQWPGVIAFQLAFGVEQKVGRCAAQLLFGQHLVVQADNSIISSVVRKRRLMLGQVFIDSF